ncbi:MAG: hypothetical protein U1A78_21610 [Polyangia bacterium]
MSHKHDHKKDKDAFESQIGVTDPGQMPGLQSPLSPNTISPLGPMGPGPSGPSGPGVNLPELFQDGAGKEQSKDKGKGSKDKDHMPSGLTHAAGEAMAHWSEAAGTNKAPMDSLTVADRERKMNKKKGDGDADTAKGNDHDKDKSGKEQTVS